MTLHDTALKHTCSELRFISLGKELKPFELAILR
jgi:hypothetical protein